MVKCSKNIISANYHSANRNKEVAKLNYENTYEEITRRYYQAVYNYCQVRLKDEYAAEDCTQDVFLLLYRKMNKLKLSENIRAWLYRTADRIIKNYRKNQSKDISIDNGETNDLSITDKYNEDVPFENVLNSDERKLITAYYIDGVDIITLSKMFGKNEGAIYKRLQRIKRKIEESMYKTDNT